MKKLIFALFAGILLSCSNDSSDNSSSGTIKWKFKVDGVQYEWSGNYPYSQTSGQSTYGGEPISAPLINLASPIISSGNRQVIFIFIFPNESTGPRILDGSSTENSAVLTINGSKVYGTYPNLGQINLNITQMASATGGITKGTFSGTMIEPTQQLKTVEITEGSFEAIRIQ